MKNPSSPKTRFGTLAVHAGQEPEPMTGAIVPPIFQTSTYVQPDVAEPKQGYDYARVKNPTTVGLEQKVAALEGGAHGIAFSSGLAAIEAVVKCLSAGDHIVCEENTYGGVIRMYTGVLAKLGLEFSYVDTRDPERIRDAMRPNTRLVHVETPTNPMMRICDIRAAADVAHEGDALLMVDSTFASPFNQQPLALGADVSMHSSTKYLNGHSDIIGGVLVLNDDELAEDIHFVRKSSGAVPGPLDAWLCLRGIRTLQRAYAVPQRERTGGSPGSWKRTARSNGSSTRVWSPIPSTVWQRTRCRATVEWWPSTWATRCEPGPWPPILVCSSLRRAWAVSNLSSAYRPSRPTHRCRRRYVRRWVSRRDWCGSRSAWRTSRI